jgi:predicted NBD/HSP70 family sugar kinase
VSDHAAVDVRRDRAEALLERRLRVDSVQVVEPDRLGPQRAQTLLDLRLEHLRPTLARAVAALGGDEHVLGGAVERLADRALALAARVQVRSVDVAHARGHGPADERHMLGRGGQTVRAQAEAGHVEAGKPEAGHAVEG